MVGAIKEGTQYFLINRLMCEYNCTHLFYIAFHFAHKDEVVVSITVFKCFVGSHHMEHNFALPI